MLKTFLTLFLVLSGGLFFLPPGSAHAAEKTSPDNNVIMIAKNNGLKNPCAMMTNPCSVKNPCAAANPCMGANLKNKPFPRYVNMPDDVVTLDQMINFCMTNPMKSKALRWNSKRLTALNAYVRKLTNKAVRHKNPCMMMNPCSMKNPCMMKNPCSGR